MTVNRAPSVLALLALGLIPPQSAGGALVRPLWGVRVPFQRSHLGERQRVALFRSRGGGGRRRRR